MRVHVNKLFPQSIFPVRFGCGVIYRASFQDIACTDSYFGVVEKLQQIWWVHCRRDNTSMSQGGIYGLNSLDLTCWPMTAIDEFETPEPDEKIGAIQFLIRQAEITNNRYCEIENG